LRPLLLLWLAGLCLRTTVLAIPPVIPQIHATFSMSQAAVGALTALPVLLFSFAAIPGSLLVSRFGPAHVMTAGIFITAAAGAARGLSPSLTALFLTTFAMGFGIAIMQPALPAVVREWTPQRVALGIAVYSNGLLVGEALSASLTIPFVLPATGGDWRMALAVWSIPVAIFGVLAAIETWRRHEPRGSGDAKPWWPDWRNPLTWKLGLLSGYASALYFGTNAFLPDFLAARGRPDLLNPALSALNWVQLPASFLMLAFADRLTMRRWPFLSLGALSIAATFALVALPVESAVWWTGILGFCNAFLLILTMALPPLLAESRDVHRLSAAMIAIGYLSAFLVPILGGFLWDVSGLPSAGFVPILTFGGAALFLAATLRFPRRTHE
jgi:CP family cyanate transporter-like MFS transporter